MVNNKMIRDQEDSIRVLSESASELAHSGDIGKAVEKYEEILVQSPNHSETWLALGHCYLMLEDIGGCHRAYSKSVSLGKKDPQLWFGIGLFYLKVDDLSRAESAFQSVLQMDPAFEGKSEVQLKLGQILLKRGDSQGSLSFFRNASSSSANSTKILALCMIGNLFQKENQLDQALSEYTEALKIDENHSKALQYMGWVLFELGRVNEAIDCLTKSYQNSQSLNEKADINYLIGRCYLAIKQLESARWFLNEAFSCNQKSFVYWTSAGIMYAESKQSADALHCFQEALEISPRSPLIWFNIAVLYETCKRRKDAAHAYQRAFSLDCDNKVARQRKTLIQTADDDSTPPDFVHPHVEINETSFALSSNNIVHPVYEFKVEREEEPRGTNHEGNSANNANTYEHSNDEHMNEMLNSQVFHNVVRDSMNLDEGEQVLEHNHEQRTETMNRNNVKSSNRTKLKKDLKKKYKNKRAYDSEDKTEYLEQSTNEGIERFNHLTAFDMPSPTFMDFSSTDTTYDDRREPNNGLTVDQSSSHPHLNVFKSSRLPEIPGLFKEEDVSNDVQPPTVPERPPEACIQAMPLNSKENSAQSSPAHTSNGANYAQIMYSNLRPYNYINNTETTSPGVCLNNSTFNPSNYHEIYRNLAQIQENNSFPQAVPGNSFYSNDPRYLQSMIHGRQSAIHSPLLKQMLVQYMLYFNLKYANLFSTRLGQKRGPNASDDEARKKKK